MVADDLRPLRTLEGQVGHDTRPKLQLPMNEMLPRHPHEITDPQTADALMMESAIASAASTPVVVRPALQHRAAGAGTPTATRSLLLDGNPSSHRLHQIHNASYHHAFVSQPPSLQTYFEGDSERHTNPTNEATDDSNHDDCPVSPPRSQPPQPPAQAEYYTLSHHNPYFHPHQQHKSLGSHLQHYNVALSSTHGNFTIADRHSTSEHDSPRAPSIPPSDADSAIPLRSAGTRDTSLLNITWSPTQSVLSSNAGSLPSLPIPRAPMDDMDDNQSTRSTPFSTHSRRQSFLPPPVRVLGSTTDLPLKYAPELIVSPPLPLVRMADFAQEKKLGSTKSHVVWRVRYSPHLQPNTGIQDEVKHPDIDKSYRWAMKVTTTSPTPFERIRRSIQAMRAIRLLHIIPQSTDWPTVKLPTLSPAHGGGRSPLDVWLATQYQQLTPATILTHPLESPEDLRYSVLLHALFSHSNAHCVAFHPMMPFRSAMALDSTDGEDTGGVSSLLKMPSTTTIPAGLTSVGPMSHALLSLSRSCADRLFPDDDQESPHESLSTKEDPKKKLRETSDRSPADGASKNENELKTSDSQGLPSPAKAEGAASIGESDAHMSATEPSETSNKPGSGNGEGENPEILEMKPDSYVASPPMMSPQPAAELAASHEIPLMSMEKIDLLTDSLATFASLSCPCGFCPNRYFVGDIRKRKAGARQEFAPEVYGWHPYIVRIERVWVERGYVISLMQLCEGQDLEQRTPIHHFQAGNPLGVPNSEPRVLTHTVLPTQTNPRDQEQKQVQTHQQQSAQTPRSTERILYDDEVDDTGAEGRADLDDSISSLIEGATASGEEEEEEDDDDDDEIEAPSMPNAGTSMDPATSVAQLSSLRLITPHPRASGQGQGQGAIGTAVTPIASFAVTTPTVDSRRGPNAVPAGPFILSNLDLWKVLHQISSALVHLHARGILHADVKPANIYVTADGDVCLGDFNGRLLFRPTCERPELSDERLCNQLAQIEQDEESAVLLSDVEGDGRFLAPEVLVEGASRASARAVDIYALGFSLYQLATGELVRNSQFGSKWLVLRSIPLGLTTTGGVGPQTGDANQSVFSTTSVTSDHSVIRDDYPQQQQQTSSGSTTSALSQVTDPTHSAASAMILAHLERLSSALLEDACNPSGAHSVSEELRNEATAIALEEAAEAASAFGTAVLRATTIPGDHDTLAPIRKFHLALDLQRRKHIPIYSLSGCISPGGNADSPDNRSISHELVELILRMISPSPDDRPTARELFLASLHYLQQHM